MALLVPAGQPVTVAVDDALFRRRGKEVRAAGWFCGGSAPRACEAGYGSNWVIAAVIVRLPMAGRPVAVPVLAKLVIKGTTSASRLWLDRRMAQMLAGALAGRDTHVVAGAAYPGKELKALPPGITWTTRLRKDAAPYELPPARTRRRGRPRAKGDKLRSLARLAADAAFTPAAVTRYGKTATIGAAAITCLWYGPFGIRAGRAGNTPAAGCPPAVSAPDGHGMILTGRRADTEDTTYRVIWRAGARDELRALRGERDDRLVRGADAG